MRLLIIGFFCFIGSFAEARSVTKVHYHVHLELSAYPANFVADEDVEAEFEAMTPGLGVLPGEEQLVSGTSLRIAEFAEGTKFEASLQIFHAPSQSNDAMFLSLAFYKNGQKYGKFLIQSEVYSKDYRSTFKYRGIGTDDLYALRNGKKIRAVPVVTISNIKGIE